MGAVPWVAPRAATSYVGREREAAQISTALESARLVTLTGPGGVGKTRLAEAIGAVPSTEFPDGVVLIGLAELSDGDQLPYLVSTVLGMHPTSATPLQVVLEHLSHKRILLILDNCEHVVDAAAAFASAVICGEARVLATSRQSLAVPGEQVIRVPPLSLPADGGAALSDVDAVRLFAERAATALPGFELTEDNSDAVVAICRHLDGLPLAIELAAAQMRTLSAQQIAERLAGQLPLPRPAPRMVPQRQRTLGATLDWSFTLCSRTERELWARASIFAGSFDIEAAELVCAGPQLPLEQVVVGVDGLIDKSVLVREDHEGVVRYRMLETIRQYGRSLLDMAGELDTAARRHSEWVDRFTADADANWAGPEQLSWIGRLNLEQANIRAAVDWSLADPAEAGAVLRLGSRLDEYWIYFGHSRECRTWLDRALELTTEDHPDRVRGLTGCALQAVWHLDLERAAVCLDQADRLLTGRGEELSEAFVTYVRALAAQIRTDPRAVELAAAAAAVFRSHGQVRRELHPLWIYGVTIGYRRSDVVAGRRALHRMLALCEECGETRYRAMAQFGLAYLEVERGDVAAAADLAEEALRNLAEVGRGSGTAYVMDALAWIADRQKRHERAATLFGAAHTVWRDIGSRPEIAVSGPHLSHVASTRAALGATGYERAHAVGRSFTYDEAMNFALSESAGTAQAPHIGLTRREWEIAALVAEGLSNQSIADRLFISHRTAATHVQNILVKLGFRNRTQVATWFTSKKISSR
ncbi:LuxR C-terminal-related transcriptional regulator [Nocardia fluminea]|uniref:LuxR C-terminal-related transcriptional regulator n=1 Tax=Nocardia fluminea TaxID=134984 RepID=UPI00344658CF